MSHAGLPRTTQLTLLAAGALLAALYPLQAGIDARLKTVQQEKDELVLRSGGMLKRMSLGYDSMLAVIYWTRAVQYYGGKLRDHDPHFELLAPLLDLTVGLDPHLLVAYKFGGTFLSEPAPRGAGRADLAAKLLRRGIAANPDEWTLWADLGFVYYLYAQDYQKASESFLEGSKHPQAGPWMRVMAAKIAGEGGSRAISLFLWAQIFQTTKDPLIKRNAREHWQTLKAEEDAEQLEKLAAAYRSRFGRVPASVQEMVSAGMLPARPVDPAGYPYVLAPGGKVRLHPASPVTSKILRPEQAR